MALDKNHTKSVIKTKENNYEFDAPSTEGIDARVLEIVYIMRTRIEENFSAIKVVFKQARLLSRRWKSFWPRGPYPCIGMAFRPADEM